MSPRFVRALQRMGLWWTEKVRKNHHIGEHLVGKGSRQKHTWDVRIAPLLFAHQGENTFHDPWQFFVKENYTSLCNERASIRSTTPSEDSTKEDVCGAKVLVPSFLFLYRETFAIVPNDVWMFSALKRRDTNREGSFSLFPKSPNATEPAALQSRRVRKNAS